ncbi:unnamed protein product [Closterium sp. NIES-64]|nr:unnamed protein product [Closterium sp. NIES-64]
MGAVGQQWRRSLLNPRLPSFRASRGQRGARWQRRGHQEAPLCNNPPPVPFSMAGSAAARRATRSVSGSGAAGRVTRTECQWKWGGRPGDTDGGPTRRVPTSVGNEQS